MCDAAAGGKVKWCTCFKGYEAICKEGFFSCWEGNFCGHDPKLAEMQYGDIVQCHWSLDY
jgi:hypothetical protein